MRFPLIAPIVLLCMHTSQAAAAAVTSKLETRQTNDFLFKGEKIPAVNWTSNDISNFTLGLTGVNNYENFAFGSTLITTLSFLLIAIFLYRLLVAHVHRLRLISSLGANSTASYFAQPQSGFLRFLQKHLLLAPLLRRRHNEPILSILGNLYLGTLPSRINAIFLFCYILSNVLYCTLALPWGGNIGPDFKLEAPTKASLVAEFRGRTGVMATFNLIPLFVCMMRNNYVGKVAGVPGGFNTWNLYHRWAGRIVAIESFSHMGAWMVNKVDQSGWEGIGKAVKGSRFLQMGLMAEASLVLIIVFSVAPLRHAHYEVFLGAHQLCVITFLTGAWLHCYTDELPQITHVNIAIGIWIAERFHRVFTICRKNLRLGRNWSANTAEVSVVPAGEDAVRVSITMHKGWEFQPGQHAYLYIPRLSWTQSHPFSIAWSSTTESEVDDLKVFHPAQSSTAVIGEKLNDTQFEMRPTSFNAELYSTSPTSSSSEIRSTSSVAHRNLTVSNPRTTIHFVISRRGGFTNRLFEAAGNGTNHKYPEMAHIAPQRFLALVEGPYCNEVHNFDSFASLLFVAGGSGITHPLGYVRHLLSASANRLVAARRIKLVWVIRDRRNIFWINDWLEELWRLDAGRGIFEMEIYVTRPSSTSHRAVDLSGGTQVKWFPGRPQMEDILAGMITPSRMRNGRGALSVNVCGPGSLADGVRAAVRAKLEEARIELSEESFTWS